MAEFPENEFVTDRGYLRVKQCSLKYLDKMGFVATDGEPLPYRLHECRMKFHPLPATILV